jgi:tetratricopeptide (TPR) repeat protein
MNTKLKIDRKSIVASIVVTISLSIAILSIPKFFDQSGNPPITKSIDFGYPFDLPDPQHRRSQLQEEVSFYRARVDRDLESGLSLAGLANAYWKIGRNTGEVSWLLLAERTAQKSLSSLPFNNIGARLTLARIAQNRHDFITANKIVADIFKEKPNHREAEAILVTSYLATGNLSEAEKIVYSLAKRSPNLDILTLQALVSEARGKENTPQQFQQAIAAEEPGEIGSSALVRVLFGRYYFRQGKFDRAAELYGEAMRMVPNYPLAAIEFAVLETRRGNYTAAERLYDRVPLYYENTGTIYDSVVWRGKARLQQLQGKEFNSLLDRVEALLREDLGAGNSGNFGHRRELAELLLDRDRPENYAEAWQLMEAEVKIRQDAATLATLARALTKVNRLQEARSTIEKALATGTRDPNFFTQAAEIERQLGNVDRVNFYTQKARQIVDQT